MSEIVRTVKIQSSHPESQGDFVEINEEDFDKEKHELYVEKKPAKAAAQETGAEGEPNPAAPKKGKK
jgi:hypothetical protein